MLEQRERERKSEPDDELLDKLEEKHHHTKTNPVEIDMMLSVSSPDVWDAIYMKVYFKV